MAFLHDGLPRYTRRAEWSGRKVAGTEDEGARAQGREGTVKSEIRLPNPKSRLDFTPALLWLLSHYNIASKEWVVRQYDHEVQGGSAIKPLVGVANDGPGDGAVFTPVLGSRRGVALACGLSPRLGDIDPYQMALHAIDECVRNLVCVGADFERIAILDNFCWGNCAKPDRFGSLVLAAQACHDGALAYGTPFISGKDSLNNEFVTEDGRVISIPPTLLISGIAIVPDVTRCVTMDAKAVGNLLVVVGLTQPSLAGSHFELIDVESRKLLGTQAAGAYYCTPGGSARVPQVSFTLGPQVARAVAGAIAGGLVRSAHDTSEGGLAVAISEMAFAGGLGVDADLDPLPAYGHCPVEAFLFGESPSRYLLEVEPEKIAALEAALAGVPHAILGKFTLTGKVELRAGRSPLVSADIADLKRAWQSPLDWK